MRHLQWWSEDKKQRGRFLASPSDANSCCSSLTGASCVHSVCRQVAGNQYTQWDDFHVDGRRDGGGQEMTLEDLIRHIEVERGHTAQLLHTRRHSASLYSAEPASLLSAHTKLIVSQG